MKFDTIVIDASSIINFFKYYHSYYGFTDRQTIFEGLKDFLVNKIKKGEIIIIDKVYDELKSFEYTNFKNEIKGNVINSLNMFSEVQNLRDKYYLKENEKFYNGDSTQIESDLEKFETTHADLFLIAECNKLKKSGKKTLLITEENFGKDRKLIEKIPVICKKENEDIWCRNIPFALFEHYKKELQFSLKIN